MNIEDVAEEIADKATAITGLRVYPFPVDNVPHNAFVLSYPDEITFDASYGRGSDEATLQAWVLVEKTHDRAAYNAFVKYLNGSGPSSIKAALDNKRLTNEYTTCDTVTVVSAVAGFWTWGGVERLGAMFNIRVTGSGS